MNLELKSKLFEYTIKFEHILKELIKYRPKTFKVMLDVLHWYNTPYCELVIDNLVNNLVRVNQEEGGRYVQRLCKRVIELGWFPQIRVDYIVKIDINGVRHEYGILTIGEFIADGVWRLNILTLWPIHSSINTTELLELLKQLVELYTNIKHGEKFEYAKIFKSVPEVVEYVKQGNYNIVISHWFRVRYIGGNVLVIDRSLRTAAPDISLPEESYFIVF